MADKRSRRDGDGLTPIGDIMRNGPTEFRPLSAHKMRMVESAVQIAEGEDDTEIAYHHTVFCQTALPYRKVEERVWERTNGYVSLSVEAGRALHPESQKWVDLPMPFGPKSRLIMIHLDTEAKLLKKPMIEIEGSMTAFITRLQGRSPNGAELRKFKEQAAAVAGALFRFAASQGDRTFQIDSKVVTGFSLWYPKDERQRVLFPSFVRLSDEYFSTLIDHAVPLDHRAIAAMQHSALALDIYKWLAQRLCRVPARKPAFIPWPMVQAQFGQGYTRIRAFRAVFLKTLREVLTQYPGAKVDADERGLKLYRSRPPILPKEHKALAW